MHSTWYCCLCRRTKMICCSCSMTDIMPGTIRTEEHLVFRIMYVVQYRVSSQFVHQYLYTGYTWYRVADMSINTAAPGALNQTINTAVCTRRRVLCASEGRAGTRKKKNQKRHQQPVRCTIFSEIMYFCEYLRWCCTIIANGNTDNSNTRYAPGICVLTLLYQ